MAIILFLGAIALGLWLFAVFQLESTTIMMLGLVLMALSLLLSMVGPAARLLGLVP